MLFVGKEWVDSPCGDNNKCNDGLKCVRDRCKIKTGKECSHSRECASRKCGNFITICVNSNAEGRGFDCNGNHWSCLSGFCGDKGLGCL